MEAGSRNDDRAVHRLVTQFAFSTRHLQMALNRLQNAGAHEEIVRVVERVYATAAADDAADADSGFFEDERARAVLEFEAAAYRRGSRATAAAAAAAEAEWWWCVRCENCVPAEQFSGPQKAEHGAGRPAYCINRARHSSSTAGRVFGPDVETQYMDVADCRLGGTTPPRLPATRRRRRKVIQISDSEPDSEPESEPVTAAPPARRRSARIASAAPVRPGTYSGRKRVN
jgi:hypothetical protein